MQENNDLRAALFPKGVTQVNMAFCCIYILQYSKQSKK